MSMRTRWWRRIGWVSRVGCISVAPGPASGSGLLLEDATSFLLLEGGGGFILLG